MTGSTIASLRPTFVLYRDDKGKFILAPHTKLVEIFDSGVERLSLQILTESKSP